MDRYEHFTEEALKAQDGKIIPLTLENGGPVIGEATMRYRAETGELIADMRIDNAHVAGFFIGEASAVIFKRES